MLVVCAFNANNLPEVAREMRKRLPNARIVIAADDDWKTTVNGVPHNPGVHHAEKAAAAVNGVVIKPEFGDDRSDGETNFNDMGRRYGLDAVLERLATDAPDWTPSSASSQPDADEPLFKHWTVDPWPEPVDGAALLDAITALLKRHLHLPEHGAETIALWIVLSWCADDVDILPMLFLRSPIRECGKTTTIEIIHWLTRRSVSASNISPAALFRFIEQESPTLLIDEADSFATDNEELRGILNAGHTRTSASVIRTVGQGADMGPGVVNT